MALAGWSAVSNFRALSLIFSMFRRGPRQDGGNENDGTPLNNKIYGPPTRVTSHAPGPDFGHQSGPIPVDQLAPVADRGQHQVGPKTGGHLAPITCQAQG